MSIGELGSLGDFLSSLGVMVTLIYLIIEVRRNTRASLDTSMQRSFERFSHLRSIVATNPQLAASTFEFYVSILDNNLGRRFLSGMPFPPSFTQRLAERLGSE